MATPKVGNKAPVFKGICTGEGNVDLSKLKGKKVILYFYPKDSTPGCTTEGQNFRDLYKQFKEKSMYGRKYMGIERSTFLIDEKGKLIQEWRKVKVTGHAQEVLDTIKSMK